MASIDLATILRAALDYLSDHSDIYFFPVVRRVGKGETRLFILPLPYYAVRSLLDDERKAKCVFSFGRGVCQLRKSSIAAWKAAFPYAEWKRYEGDMIATGLRNYDSLNAIAEKEGLPRWRVWEKLVRAKVADKWEADTKDVSMLSKAKTDFVIKFGEAGKRHMRAEIKGIDGVLDENYKHVN